MTDPALPAWSDAFLPDARAGLERDGPLGVMDRAAVFGASDGAGVTVAIIDSGVEGDHPAIGGRLSRSLRVEVGDGFRVVDDPEAVDLVGHGTACAGIIHAIAPAAELVSIRVLGADNRGGGAAFAAALEWAIGQRFGVVNLSLSSRSESMAGRFHELADAAYFANTLLVCAANNVTGPSYPSLFAAVISVAAHDVRDPDVWFYNPRSTGRVRRARPRRRRRVASRGEDPCHGELVRGAASGRPSRPDPRRAPGGDPVRGQDPPGGDGHRPPDMTTPPGRWAVSLVTVGGWVQCSGPTPSSSVGMASPPWLGDRWEIPAGGAGTTQPWPSTSVPPSIGASAPVGWSDPVTWSLGSRIFLFVIVLAPSVVVASTT